MVCGSISRMNTCKIDGCGGLDDGHHRGWCVKHYSRWIRHGNPLARFKNANGEGGLDGRGYRMVTVNGRRLQEHRAVMEQIIGRRLETHEVVHHKDHNGLNNDPDNLQILTYSGHRKIHAGFRDETHKQCSKCKAVKPRSEFGRHAKTRANIDINRCECKACSRRKKSIADTVI